jgi:hypothetical protein
VTAATTTTTGINQKRRRIRNETIDSSAPGAHH